MQNKINFIISSIGGESLAHVMQYFTDNVLALKHDGFFEFYTSSFVEHEVVNNGYLGDYSRFNKISNWQLLKDNKLATIHDQSEETVNQLFKIMGVVDEK